MVELFEYGDKLQQKVITRGFPLRFPPGPHTKTFACMSNARDVKSEHVGDLFDSKQLPRIVAPYKSILCSLKLLVKI